MTGSEGPITMMKMAELKNRNVDSVLIFPEEFFQFTKENPKHSLKFLGLVEGDNFAPIRASCPNTEKGRFIISTINDLLNAGLREKVFQLFLDVLPNIPEIRTQAVLNQRCIQDKTCKDPLTAE